jgi:hypothetical protein
MSTQSITGLFTLLAGLGSAAVVGLFDWLGRRGDRDAAERRHDADLLEHREDRRAADFAAWRDTAADVLGRVRELMTDAHPHRVTVNINRETGSRTSWR